MAFKSAQDVMWKYSEDVFQEYYVVKGFILPYKLVSGSQTDDLFYLIPEVELRIERSSTRNCGISKLS